MLTAFLPPIKQPVSEEAARFETEPSVQMQVDFTVIRRGHNPLPAFVATLGWSRATFVKFYSKQDSAAWGYGIESALKFFGGTLYKFLFDNAKTIIIERNVYGPGKHRWYPQLMTRPLRSMALPPRSVAHIAPGPRARWRCLTITSRTVLSSPWPPPSGKQGWYWMCPPPIGRIGEWLVTIANTRVHGTTGVPPEQRMPRERQHYYRYRR